MRKIYNNHNGFTLIELLVAIAIFSIVTALVVNSRSEQQEQHITQLQAVEMQQSARAVLLLMKQELRMAGFNPLSQSYGEGVDTADDTTITFSSVSSDTGGLDTITYTWVDGDGDGDFDITKSENGGAAQVIAENITAFSFDFFDGVGNQLLPEPVATPSNIRSVQITLTSQVDQDHRDASLTNNTRTLSTRVFLRNM